MQNIIYDKKDNTISFYLREDTKEALSKVKGFLNSIISKCDDESFNVWNEELYHLSLEELKDIVECIQCTFLLCNNQKFLIQKYARDD